MSATGMLPARVEAFRPFDAFEGVPGTIRNVGGVGSYRSSRHPMVPLAVVEPRQPGIKRGPFR